MLLVMPSLHQKHDGAGSTGTGQNELHCGSIKHTLRLQYQLCVCKHSQRPLQLDWAASLHHNGTLCLQRGKGPVQSHIYFDLLVTG